MTYLNSHGFMYKRRLPLSKAEIDYEATLNRLDGKLYFLFSQLKLEVEDRETEWLKFGVVIDFYYRDFYLKSVKKFCFKENEHNLLEKYHNFTELISVGHGFSEEDRDRKIRFMVCEDVPSLEEENGDGDDTSMESENYDYDRDMLDDYNRQAERDARQEANSLAARLVRERQSRRTEIQNIQENFSIDDFNYFWENCNRFF